MEKIDANALEASTFRACFDVAFGRFEEHVAGTELEGDALEEFYAMNDFREPDTMVVYFDRGEVVGASMMVAPQVTYACICGEAILCYNGRQRAHLSERVKGYRSIVYCRTLRLEDAVDGRQRWAKRA